MTLNLLDLDYYRQVNPDLANLTDEEATEHFFNVGLSEGLDFSPVVALELYQAANPDLAAAGFTENRQFFDHLAEFGVAEGRLFSRAFQTDFYRASQTDLAGLDNEQLFEHFLQFGINEGRVASNLFDIGFYLSQNTDLVAAGLTNRQALAHFSQFGINEGRSASPQFDVQTYLGLNFDLTEAGLTNSQAFEHYQLLGINEGRIAAPVLPVPGNAGSIDLGVVAGNRRFDASDFENIDDPQGNTYLFTLLRPSVVNASLATRDLPMNFLDSTISLFADLNGNGQLDADEPQNSNSGLFSISNVLPPGNYGLDVPPASVIVDSPDLFPSIAPALVPYDADLLVSPVEDVPADNAGNSIATARDLGTLTTAQTFTDSLGLLDTTDLYRFTLDAPTNFEAILENTDRGFSVDLIQDFNNNGVIDKEDFRPEGAGGDIQDILFFNNFFADYTELIADSDTDRGVGVILDAGTYFLELLTEEDGDGGFDTDYTLTLSPQASQLPADGVGNILATAFDTGVLDTPRSFTETVGEFDNSDYYQFEIETPTNVGITFESLTGSASLKIGRDFDAGSSESIILERRDILQETPFGSIVPNPISWSLYLTPGTYFAQVSDNFFDSAEYQLDIAPTPAPGLPPDGAGSNSRTARDLDVLTGMTTVSDTVGPADEGDVYRFVIESPSTVDVSIEATASGTAVGIRVFNDLDNNGSTSPPEEFSQFIPVDAQTLTGQGSLFLEPGVYFASIYNSFVPENIDYDLSLSVI
ncbi:MAG: hypothetical protein SWY16_16495 [Cyanobacteriota bacterium]|nr:hypothetical protein [Cyanobacteriota bacterium]